MSSVTQSEKNDLYLDVSKTLLAYRALRQDLRDRDLYPFTQKESYRLWKAEQGCLAIYHLITGTQTMAGRKPEDDVESVGTMLLEIKQTVRELNEKPATSAVIQQTLDQSFLGGPKRTVQYMLHTASLTRRLRVFRSVKLPADAPAA